MKTDKQAIKNLDLQLRKVLDLQSQLTLKFRAFSKIVIPAFVGMTAEH